MTARTEHRSTAQRTTPRHEVFWRTTEAVEPGPPLRGDETCDVALVGGGYTALWTAHYLKAAEPSLDVRIVEADYAGAGASGHNDGFITPTIGHGLEGLLHRSSAEEARRAYSVVGRSIVEIQRFCRKNGIDAEIEPNGYYMVATSSGQLRRLEHEVGLIEKISGSAMPLLSGRELRDRIDSPALVGGFLSGGALINPHRLARGLVRVVRSQGVTVYENSRVTDYRPANDGYVVTTPGGTLRAGQVVLATNAYQHQLPEFRRSLVPVWSYAAVTEPLSDEMLAAVHWPDREGFVETRNFIVFCRLTAENRLLVGGGPAKYHFRRDMDEAKHIRDDRVFDLLRGHLRRYFPQWRDLEFEYAYGGCVAFTRDALPHVGSIDPRLHYAHGYCGNGIAVTHTVGRTMRDLVLGRESAYRDLLFVGRKEPALPPEPVAYAGSRLVTAALAAQDRFPGVVTRSPV